MRYNPKEKQMSKRQDICRQARRNTGKEVPCCTKDETRVCQLVEIKIES